MKIDRLSLVMPFVLAFGVAGLGASGHAAKNSADLDPRLASFLEFVIHDPKTLENEKRDYASRGVTFEAFVYAVYTRAVEFDNTPDNSMALAQLGQFLEEQRPELSPQLADRLAVFHAVEANQTFMRGMFLQTVRGLGVGARTAADSDANDVKAHGTAERAPRSTSAMRFGGLENEATGAAWLARQGAFLVVGNIGASGADGVRIRLPKGATQVRVRAQFPDEPSFSAGDYLEITSRPSASSDSLGFLTITRVSADDGYDVSGALTNVESAVLVVLRRGIEVRRDALSPGAGPFARVKAFLKFESSLNDAVSGSSGAVLRWQWSSPSDVTITRRADGPDTTVVADELRLIDATAGSGTSPSLSELAVRGRNLGEIRIRAEEVLRRSRP